jgi:DNA-binding transcriptional ArsR family regulator
LNCVGAPDLSLVFAALADPTRRAIIAQLARSDLPVKDLATPFALTGPALTKHLKVLERAGLISRTRQGQQRPCHLEPSALEPAAEWIAEYRGMWEERLDRLGEFLATVVVEAAEGTARPPVRRPKKPSPRSRGSKRAPRAGKK